jgi:hypothetical protein
VDNETMQIVHYRMKPENVTASNASSSSSEPQQEKKRGGSSFMFDNTAGGGIQEQSKGLVEKLFASITDNFRAQVGNVRSAVIVSIFLR